MISVLLHHSAVGTFSGNALVAIVISTLQEPYNNLLDMFFYLQEENQLQNFLEIFCGYRKSYWTKIQTQRTFYTQERSLAKVLVKAVMRMRKYPVIQKMRRVIMMMRRVIVMMRRVIMKMMRMIMLATKIK